jgi:hypothetical protein
MANREQGEYAIRIGGQNYTLKLGTGALIELQECCSTRDELLSIEQIFAEVSRGRLKFVRAFLWAGLRKYHSHITLDGVDDLLDQADESEIRVLLISLGVTLQPAPEDVKALEDASKRNPPAAQPKKRRKRGTSTPSIEAPVAISG